ncbi:hypothetical protein IID20_00200 [Patescibacteria group bacterium]|nr:hypothetical protein [Patescibacteria group bacterium]
MFPVYTVFIISIIFTFLSFTLFKEKLKKISFKLLLLIFSLSRLIDDFSTFLCLEKYGLENEINFIIKWMIINIDLPNMLVLLIHDVVSVSFLFLLFKLFWLKSRFYQFGLRSIILVLTIAGFVASIFNFVLYFS